MSDTFAESRSRMRLVRVYSLIIDNAAEQLVDRSPLGGFRRRMRHLVDPALHPSTEPAQRAAVHELFGGVVDDQAVDAHQAHP